MTARTTTQRPDTEPTVWTRREVEKQEAFVQETTDRIAELTDTVARLNQQIAERALARADVSASQTERDTAKQLLADLENTLPVLREKVAERRVAMLAAEAEALQHSNLKSAGGLVGEYERDLERFAEDVTRIEDRATKMNDKYGTYLQRQAENGTLEKRFGLTPRDLKSFPPPGRDPRVIALVDRMLALAHRFEERPRRGVVIEPDSDAARLLAEAGPSPEEQAETERQERAREAQRQHAEAVAASLRTNDVGATPEGLGAAWESPQAKAERLQRQRKAREEREREAAQFARENSQQAGRHTPGTLR